MSTRDLLTRIPFRIWLLLLLSLFWPASQVWAEDDIPWQEIRTKHTIIRYKNLEDLKKFDQRVKYYPVTSASGLQWLFSKSGKDDPEGRLKKKVDALFKRVQEILGMYKRMERVKVNVYHDKKQLHKAYYKIFKRRCRLRAWYIFENNTIYITLEDMHEGMLAHEMAHSIIDHYLTVRPPTASAEILARYVDDHLFK